MNQTATLPEITSRNAFNYSDKKELIEARSLIVDMKERVVIRWYASRNGNGMGPLYCSVWVYGDSLYTSGTGKASGGGYCKRSAAAQAAFDSAGVKLSERIDGVGMEAVRDALRAIGRAVDPAAAKFLIVEHS